MKKYYLIVLAIVFTILLSSCNIDKVDIRDRIVAPENTLPVLQGKWIIERSIDSPYKRGEGTGESQINKEMLFHKEAIVIGENYTYEPSFKLRNVDLSNYLLYKYKIEQDYLGILEEEVEIITIYNNNQYFFEFIRYKDDEMITFVDDVFYYLKKNVDEISKDEIDRYINIEKTNMRITNIEEVDSLRSGVLIGIKTYNYDETSGNDNWQYKTIWIRSNNRSLGQIYEMPDLLLPRKRGFWLVDVKRSNDNNVIRDEIRAIQKTKFTEEDLERISLFTAKSKEDYKMVSKPSILKEILYIGNDYVSTEVVDKTNNTSRLEIYPIDYLENEKPIKISEILGEDGLRVFREGAKSILKMDPDVLLNEESFGLARRNGYWIMKGRINYTSENEELYKDFNIKAIPPKELVNYDELFIPWNIIKATVPEAIDAFTSPNEDLIIIVTRNNLLIYAIQDKEISKTELGRIKLATSDTIIMAEWAMGRYARLWEEEFLKNEAEAIEY